MVFDLFIAGLVVWETVYSVSFSAALLSKGQKSGGIFVLILTALAALLCLNYLFGFISL